MRHFLWAKKMYFNRCRHGHEIVFRGNTVVRVKNSGPPRPLPMWLLSPIILIVSLRLTNRNRHTTLLALKNYRGGFDGIVVLLPLKSRKTACGPDVDGDTKYLHVCLAASVFYLWSRTAQIITVLDSKHIHFNLATIVYL